MGALFDIKKFRTAHCRGSAAVEFALVLPVLLMILFGTIEYSWYLTWQFVLNNAVAQGARVGVSAREWEDEDPEAMAREAVTQSCWLLGTDQAEAFRETIQTTIIENDDLRTLEVVVAGLTYQPVTGFLPETLIPQHVGAKAVMAFPR